MSTRDTMPILLVDTDALADMSPWEELALAREWVEFFSHIPEAKPRDNDLLDMLELAKSDGCWVSYTSRWGTEHRPAVRDWLQVNGFPRGMLYTRDHIKMHPTAVAHVHARLITAKTRGHRPVFVIHNDPKVAAELRERGVTALSADQVPTTVKEFRAILQHARFVPFKPKPKKEGTPR